MSTGNGLRKLTGEPSIADLENKIARIYEIFDVSLEDDPASCINMVQYYQELWASWQINGKRKEALDQFANPDNWYYDPPNEWKWAGSHPLQLASIDDATRR